MMKEDVPTKHWRDGSSYMPGYVYLVLRHSTPAIKIGSTLWCPKGRIDATADCESGNFLIACYTAMPRELEHSLHEGYTCKKFGGIRDTFALTGEDVLALGLWFAYGSFDYNGDVDDEMSLVDVRGNLVSSTREAAMLLVNAVRIADTAARRRSDLLTDSYLWIESARKGNGR